jgi:hypothetical protein
LRKRDVEIFCRTNKIIELIVDIKWNNQIERKEIISHLNDILSYWKKWDPKKKKKNSREMKLKLEKIIWDDGNLRRNDDCNREKWLERCVSLNIPKEWQKQYNFVCWWNIHILWQKKLSVNEKDSKRKKNILDKMLTGQDKSEYKELAWFNASRENSQKDWKTNKQKEKR